MTIAAALLLLLQAEEKRGAVLEALCFLARHQLPDGSWGERPEKCSCPLRKVAEPCDAATVAPLLAALADNDPALRDAAEAKLRALGEPALPHLKRGEEDPDAEVRGRCAALRHLYEFDRREGSDAELTGLALLTFVGAGYTHFSKDEHDGFCFGTVVKKGLQWLLARQKELGAFDAKDGSADAIAALALAEAYGMTASQFLKDEAQKAIDRTAAATPRDARGLVWKGMALKSAELGELNFPKTAYESLDAIRDLSGDLATAGTTLLSIYVHKNRKDPRLGGIRALTPLVLDTEARHIATLAAFQLDGPNGPFWQSWNHELKRQILPAQKIEKGECRRGSWEGQGLRGQVRITATNVLCLEFYYR